MIADRSTQQGEQQLSIQAIRDMRKGDELCWCYSSYDNDAAWLLSYGFVPTDGCSSHPTLPPQVLHELHIPTSSTDSSDSSSGDDSGASSESCDGDISSASDDSDSGNSDPGQETSQGRGSHMDNGVRHGATFSSGAGASDTTPHACREQDVITAGQPAGSTAEAEQAHNSECKQGCETSLPESTTYLAELDAALNKVRALELSSQAHGLFMLLQRERDYLEKAMKASFTAAAKRHDVT